jgi:RNA polymerase sigma-B factor
MDSTGLRALDGASSGRERQVVELRFERDLTQAEIGKRIRVSQMQVSRGLRQALAKLAAEARSS